MRKVFFRADASAKIGYGHFTRCLALADMLKDHFVCSFVTVEPTAYQKQEMMKICPFLILNKNSHFDDFLNLLNGEEIVVLDNYFFTTDYQRKIKAKGCKLVCIDDMHDKHYVADIVINHALGLTFDKFSTEPYTQLCLGLSYALLRKPFFKKEEKAFHKGNHILICFGGADINNLTQKCIDSVLALDTVTNIDVIIGNAYRYENILIQYKKRFPQLHIYSSLNADSIIRLLQHADLAIVPASTVLWEVLSQGVSCVYGYYVDNQMDICRNVGSNDKIGVDCIGDFRKIPLDMLTERIKLAFVNLVKREVVPCFGCDKVIQNINSLFASDYTVRRAQESDIMLYLRWANDPEVRKFAFHTELIDIETHKAWFEGKLSDSLAFLYICYFKNEAIGQVRFDVEGATAIIDVSLAKEFRGKGLSVSMLKTVMEYFSINTGYTSFYSEVKNDNIPSQKLFDKAGFYEVGVDERIKKYGFLIEK